MFLSFLYFLFALSCNFYHSSIHSLVLAVKIPMLDFIPKWQAPQYQMKNLLDPSAGLTFFIVSPCK